MAKPMRMTQERGSLADAASRQLRKRILLTGDGARLGSEEEVRLDLKVSRSVLRQAARILEFEQLLLVRRGVSGGYFARRPSVRAVSRAAASYLQAHNATIGDTMRVSQVFAGEIASLAAQSEDHLSRRRLARLRNELISISPEADTSALLLRDDSVLVDAMVQMADMPILGLFQQILHEFGRQEQSRQIYRDRPDRCVEWRRQRALLIDAILTRDSEMASLLARRQNSLSRSWIEEDDPQLNSIRSD